MKIVFVASSYDTQASAAFAIWKKSSEGRYCDKTKTYHGAKQKEFEKCRLPTVEKPHRTSSQVWDINSGRK